mmetsp:Transcript_12152/g.30783  ORF Transcript_12152/g.30783 Transcript_12152/m.30783 type:complete len:424 (-) Transcript_12152:57-1328(-)
MIGSAVTTAETGGLGDGGLSASGSDVLLGGALAAVLDVPLGSLDALLEDDVDVAADQLGDLLSLEREQVGVVIGVVAKVQREGLLPGGPALEVRQRMAVQHLALHVHHHDRVSRDAQQPIQQLLLLAGGHDVLHLEESDAPGGQRATHLDVAVLGVGLVHLGKVAPRLVHVRAHLLALALLPAPRLRKHLFQLEKVLLLLVTMRIVGAVLHLSLKRGEIDCLLSLERVLAGQHCVSRLHVQQMQLHGIRGVHVGVCIEEALAQHQEGVLGHTLLVDRARRTQPVLCATALNLQCELLRVVHADRFTDVLHNLDNRTRFIDHQRLDCTVQQLELHDSMLLFVHDQISTLKIIEHKSFVFIKPHSIADTFLRRKEHTMIGSTFASLLVNVFHHVTHRHVTTEAHGLHLSTRKFHTQTQCHRCSVE